MKHPVVPRFPVPTGKLFLYMSRNSRISWILAKLAKVSCPSKVVGLTLRVVELLSSSVYSFFFSRLLLGHV